MSKKDIPEDEFLFKIISNRKVIVLRDWEYIWEHNGVKYKLLLPAGFVYDGTSNIRILWTITAILPIGPEVKYSGLHDLIYQTKGYVNATVELGIVHFYLDEDEVWQPVRNSKWTRKEGDKLFARSMRDGGIEKKRRRNMYKAVRFLGWIPWMMKMKNLTYKKSPWFVE